METAEFGVDGDLESLRPIRERLQADREFCRIIEGFRSGKGGQIDGVVGAGSALLAAAIAEFAPRGVFVVLPNARAALGFCEDFRLFSTQAVTHFPRLERIQAFVSPDDEIAGERLRILRTLACGDVPAVLVTSIEALLQTVPIANDVRSSVITLRVGESLEVSQLLKTLGEWGFRSVSTVAMPGEFSLRGGILDIFSPEWSSPLRIELFGDQIESLRQVDLETQRSVERLEQVHFAALHRQCDLSATLIDYLPEESWVLLVQPDAIDETARDYFQKLDSKTEPGHVPLNEIWIKCEKFSTVEVWDLVPESGEACFHLGMRTVERFSGQIDRIQSELDSASEGDTVYVVCPTRAEIARLDELLKNTKTYQERRLQFVEGRLTAGFRLPQGQLVVLGAHELFQRMPRQMVARRLASRPIADFLDLRVGDLVVHVAHGIARYRGLVLLNKGDQAEEHLVL